MNRFASLSVHDIRIVVELADTLHFSRAAHSLGVSQPTVSAAVNKFESVIGFPVFFRNSRRCEVTPRGNEAIGHLRKILVELDLMDPESSDQALTSPFRLGFIPTIAPFLIPELIRSETGDSLHTVSFHESHTEVLLDEILSHRIDAAVLSNATLKPNLEKALLIDEQLVCCLPASHPLTNQVQLSLSDLNPAEQLLLDRGNCLRDQVLRHCEMQDSPDRPSHSTSLATLLTLVQAGVGYALIPAMASPQAMTLPGVVIREFNQEIRREIFLIYRKNEQRKQRIQSLLTGCKSCLEALIQTQTKMS